MKLSRANLAILACASMSLVGGGTYAYMTNVLLATSCSAECSSDTRFRKPWFASFCVLFIQCIANGLVLLLVKSVGSAVIARQGKETAARVGGDDAVAPHDGPKSEDPFKEASVFERSMMVPVGIISVLDAVTVVIQAVASLYIPAAINGAMRGTLLLLTALLSRMLRVFDGGAGRAEWLGICVSTVGALGVGGSHIAAAAFPDLAGRSGPSAFSNTSADAALGVVLSLLSNFTLALSIVYETKVFEKRRPGVLSLNTTRTAYGSLLMVAALAIATAAPGSDHGAYENGTHTACCVASTPPIAGYAVTVGLGASISGSAALLLSKLAGSNFRALVYVGRALWVWCLELTVFYAGLHMADPNAPLYGRPWTLFSYPQAVGFALIVLGGVMTWRGRSRRQRLSSALASPRDPEAEEEEATGGRGGRGDVDAPWGGRKALGGPRADADASSLIGLRSGSESVSGSEAGSPPPTVGRAR